MDYRHPALNWLTIRTDGRLTWSVKEVDVATCLETLCRDLIEPAQEENGTSIALKADIKLAPQSAFTRLIIPQS